MERSKLQQIVKDKNERLERDATRNAESLIDEIAKEQERVQQSNSRIAELRKQLKELEIKQHDESVLLGGE